MITIVGCVDPTPHGMGMDGAWLGQCVPQRSALFPDLCLTESVSGSTEYQQGEKPCKNTDGIHEVYE